MVDEHMQIVLQKIDSLRELMDVEFRHMRDASQRIEDELKEVKVEQKKTNGRVTALEDSASRFKGALWIISAILLPLAFMVIASFFR